MSRSSQPSSGPSAEAGAAGLSPRPTLRWFRRSSPLPDPGRVLRRTASGFPSASHRVAPLRERNIATTDASLQAESLVRFRELFQVFATAQSSHKPHKWESREEHVLPSGGHETSGGEYRGGRASLVRENQREPGSLRVIASLYRTGLAGSHSPLHRFALPSPLKGGPAVDESWTRKTPRKLDRSLALSGFAPK
jgi:hypothetical protein